MADSQFNPLGTVTAPADWTLPASLNLQPKNVYASYDGTSAAGSFVPCLQIISDSGHTVGSYPCATTVAAGASADVTWFPGVDDDAASTAQIVVSETLTLPTWYTSVSSVNPIPSGVTAVVTVRGTYTDWNLVLDNGVPEADAQYPSTPSGVTRVTTEVGIDADTLFAYPSSHPQTIGHWTQFQVNMGSGWSHVEPVGGPYTTPQAGHVYTFHLVGQGQVAQFRINDTPLNDNYGALVIDIAGTPAPPTGLATTDGTTTVINTSELDFTSGATVTDGGNGIAQIAVTATGGVSSLNTLTGALAITAGSNITVTPSGTNIQIAASTGGIWTTIAKAADTSRTSTTTITADPELAFTAVTGGVYELEALLIYSSPAGGTSPGFKFGFGEDATTSRGIMTVFTFVSGTGTVTGSTTTGVTTSGATLNVQTATTVRAVWCRGWHVGAGGSFSVQWAQNTSFGSATVLLTGSVLRYARLV